MRWMSERASPRPRPMRSCPSKGPAGRRLLLEPEAQMTRSVPTPACQSSEAERLRRGTNQRTPKGSSPSSGAEWRRQGLCVTGSGEGRMQTEFTPQTLHRCSRWAKHCQAGGIKQ